MRLSAIAAGLFVFAIFFATNSSPVQAKELPSVAIVNSALSMEVQDPINQPLAKAPEPKPPEPKEYIVASDETLTKIAKANGTTWLRLYAKNTNIVNPDIIKAGDKIIIPLPGEVLAERELPKPPAPTLATPVGAATVPRKFVKAQPYARGSASGNTYAPGYCTYYAKQRRPDLPNNLGNANTWVARAAGQGIPTGSAPRVGAIGQAGMHVVYVEAVNANGTIRVSEMNYAGFGVVSSRTTSAGAFMYIY